MGSPRIVRPLLGLFCAVLGWMGMAGVVVAQTAPDAARAGTLPGPRVAVQAHSAKRAATAKKPAAPGAVNQRAALKNPKAPAGGPAEPLHVFGEWGGFRTWLRDRGIVYSLNYTTETAANVAGGLKTGADYAHQVALSVDVDAEKLAGLTGFSAHAIVIERAGRNASRDYVGDTVLQAQEIYGAGFGVPAKLVWLYGEQHLLDDRIEWVFGRTAPGADFQSSPLYCDFMTLTICGHDRALTANQGFEDWPQSEWGTRVKLRPITDTYVMVGAYQSQPFPTDRVPYTQGGHYGIDWSFADTTGVSVPVELGYEPKIGPDALPGHYKIGANYDTTRYPDQFVDFAGRPLALTGLPGKMRDGRTQFWVTADQMVMRQSDVPEQGLFLLAAYAHDEPNTSFFRNFAWVGLLDSGFNDARPTDRIGFGLTYYDVSPSLTATERLQAANGVPLAGGARGVQTHGMVAELNYNFQPYRGVQVQPELEYFMRPGATNAVRNAFLIGLKTNVNF